MGENPIAVEFAEVFNHIYTPWVRDAFFQSWREIFFQTPKTFSGLNFRDFKSLPISLGHFYWESTSDNDFKIEAVWISFKNKIES